MLVLLTGVANVFIFIKMIGTVWMVVTHGI